MNQYNMLSSQEDINFNDMNNDLAERIDRLAGSTDISDTEIPELTFGKYLETTEPSTLIYEPSICMAVQGAKRLTLADDIYVYDAYHFFVTSIALPPVIQVIEASPEKPYLGLMLKFDLKMVSQMMVDSIPLPRLRSVSRGMAVSKVSMPLLRAVGRLIELLDTPEHIPFLSPNIQKEILYRLLVGDQGQKLRQIAMTESHSHQIAKSIAWLKENYAKTLRIHDLASFAGMSRSTFHHHFRALTAMSPLQYQKRLRLHEARQLMLTGQMDAANAAYEVGYDCPSQFSREYSRLFGAPPLRDIKRIKSMAKDTAN